MLLTDDVYGTFVPGFRSLLGAFPCNTIGVYSYSKYFGCTGWRLGVIAVHEDNLFDELIAQHAEHVLEKLDKRYGALTLEPRKMRFIDRIVADSRDVALNHTAGLSLPQQVMMALFSLCELMDDKKDYQKACIGIVRKRVEATLEGLGIEVAPNELFDYYYGLIDFEFWARKYVGEDVVAWMKENVHPLDIVFRLAEDHGIVLLNGSGFDAPNWSVRISFANLDDYVYDDIGRAVRAVARSYRMAYQGRQHQGPRVTTTRRKKPGRWRECNRTSTVSDSPMTTWLQELLRAHPEIAFFLVLGLGHLIGKIAIGSFKLGAVTGTLLAGVIVGQLGVTLPDEVKQCFFLLFLFAIGFRTGPQFFRGLRSDGLSHAALAAIVAIAGLLVAYGFHAFSVTTRAPRRDSLRARSPNPRQSARRWMRYRSWLRPRPGAAAMENNIPVSFAVTYLVGMTVAAWVLSQLAPKLMRVDLADECRQTRRGDAGRQAGPEQARPEFELRAYAVDPGCQWIGRRISALEFSANGERVFVERVRSGGQILEAIQSGPASRRHRGDVRATHHARRRPRAERHRAA